ncbi:serine hydrolase domain-containing protein [uncultured Stenotrophomonas sp.]|uniref:serine hydrolase domain-containing protein n=1 Tax=uncultured Stenotrophomonas sp. TaxID=165438 RepID=UPI0028E7A9A7|nr:serine hydrolase domain-containing protein [uncultured Stenotrophomonas sp.]
MITRLPYTMAVMTRNSSAQSPAFGIAMALALFASSACGSDLQSRDYASGLRRSVVLEGAEPKRFSIQDRMTHYGIPGASVAVVEGCRVVDARAFGNATPAGRQVTTGTQFQAGSVSKVVTAAGALVLVDDGALSLDDDIMPKLRGWSLPRPAPYEQGAVTLRHLLTHSAGLGVAGFKGYLIGSPLPSLVQVLDGEAPANTAPVRLVDAPGAGWRYSGGGFVLTQKLMEDASGRAFQDLMHDRVLQPAGMGRSSFAPAVDPARAIEPAHGTLADGTPIPGGWRLYPEQAAAGLWTTPSDLASFGIALIKALHGEEPAFLSKKTASDMMRRQVGDWGLGLEISRDGSPKKISHTGAPVGYRTLWMMFPETCQGAVIMTNSDEGMTFTYEVARALADAFHWPDKMPSDASPSVVMTPGIASSFAGTYQLRDFPTERFEVELQQDGTVTWARQGRGRRALEAVNAGRLISPDSGMQLVARERDHGSGQVMLLDLHFPGGINVAERVITPLHQAPQHK